MTVNAEKALYSSFDSFSAVQGGGGWRYGYRLTDNRELSQIADYTVFNSTEQRWAKQYEFGDYALQYQEGGHPGTSGYSVLYWTAPGDGVVVVESQNIKLLETKGDGINISVLHNKDVLWSSWINPDDRTGESHKLYVLVKRDDVISFESHRFENNAYDRYEWSPNITYCHSYFSGADFTDRKNWSFGYRVDNEMREMVYDEALCRYVIPSEDSDGTAIPFLTAAGGHAGRFEIAKVFTAPYSGKVLITGYENVRKTIGQVGGDGVLLTVCRGKARLYETHVDGGDELGEKLEYIIDIRAGDYIYFYAHQMFSPQFDSFDWSPVVAYLENDVLSYRSDGIVINDISQLAKCDFISLDMRSVVRASDDCFAGVYDDFGNLLDLRFFTFDMPVGHFDTSSVTLSNLSHKTSVIKIFWWSDLYDMNPIDSKNIELNGQGKNIAVSFFGAVGDGVTDDSASILNALAEAINRGENSCLEFEAEKTYLIKDIKGRWPLFVLENINNLLIEGNNSTIMFETPTNTLIHIENCDNVTVKNLNIEYRELPFTQGIIREVNAGEGWFLLDLENGYPVPQPDQHVKQIHGSDPWGFGMIIDPEQPRLKWGNADHDAIYSIDNVEDRVYKVRINPIHQANLEKFKVNDRYVLRLMNLNYDTGLRKYTLNNMFVTNSSNITLEGISNYSSISMWCYLLNNDGPITVRGGGLKRKDGWLMSGCSDGIHSINSRGGLTVDRVHIEANLDDAINVHSMGIPIMKTVDRNSFIVRNEFFPDMRSGDRIMFYDPKKLESIGECRVTAVTVNYADDTTTIFVDKDIDVTRIKDGEECRFPYNYSYATVIYNFDSAGKDIIIRNSTFKQGRRYAALIRTENTIFENNYVEEMGNSGVCAQNESYGFSEGPLPRGLTVRGNMFVNNLNGQAVDVGMYGGIGAENPQKMLDNILIANNKIRGISPYGAIRVNSAVGVAIQQNDLISYEEFAEKVNSPITLKSCNDVTIEDMALTDYRNIGYAIQIINCIPEGVLWSGLDFRLSSEAQKGVIWGESPTYIE